MGRLAGGSAPATVEAPCGPFLLYQGRCSPPGNSHREGISANSARRRMPSPRARTAGLLVHRPHLAGLRGFAARTAPCTPRVDRRRTRTTAKAARCMAVPVTRTPPRRPSAPARPPRPAMPVSPDPTPPAGVVQQFTAGRIGHAVGHPAQRGPRCPVVLPRPAMALGPPLPRAAGPAPSNRLPHLFGVTPRPGRIRTGRPKRSRRRRNPFRPTAKPPLARRLADEGRPDSRIPRCAPWCGPTGSAPHRHSRSASDTEPGPSMSPAPTASVTGLRDRLVRLARRLGSEADQRGQRPVMAGPCGAQGSCGVSALAAVWGDQEHGRSPHGTAQIGREPRRHCSQNVTALTTTLMTSLGNTSR